MKTYLSFMVKGFCIGCADLVPGVSGGTMALILGVYARLIGALKRFSPAVAMTALRGDIKAACRETDAVFLGCILFGAVFAVIFFTRVADLPGWLVSYPREVYGFFFGLIIASAVLLAQKGLEYYRGIPVLFLGITAGLLVISAVPAYTPQTLWMLFLAGALASSVMLLPGISGSFVLLIIGQYSHILTALKTGDVVSITVFLCGVAVGFMLSARIIHMTLMRFPHGSYALMTGLLLGCSPALWPFQQRFYYDYGKGGMLLSDLYMPAFSGNDGITLALMASGALTVAALCAVALRKSSSSYL